MAHFIQVRGTSGAGKSTLVRRLVEDYAGERVDTLVIEGRRTKRIPVWRCRGGLHVLGMYTPGSAVGSGGDAMNKEADVREALARTDHLPIVVWESLWGSPEPARGDEFDHRTTWAVLDTPFETCMTNVRARRAARGDDPDAKLNEPKFAAEHRRIVGHAASRAQAGMPIVSLNYGPAAYDQLRGLLYFDGWRPAPGVEWPGFPWAAWSAALGGREPGSPVPA